MGKVEPSTESSDVGREMAIAGGQAVAGVFGNSQTCGSRDRFGWQSVNQTDLGNGGGVTTGRAALNEDVELLFEGRCGRC